MKLYDKGIYLLNGREVIEDGPDAAAILAQKGVTADKAEAAKGTIAYNILKAHNTSGNMEKLSLSSASSRQQEHPVLRNSLYHMCSQTAITVSAQ